MGEVGEYSAPLIIFSNYGIAPLDLRLIGTPVSCVAFERFYDERPEEVLFVAVERDASHGVNSARTDSDGTDRVGTGGVVDDSSNI